MASYEKIVKYVVERFQEALIPLEKIVENQETIIRQNAILQETVNKISQRGLAETEDVIIPCCAQASKKYEEDESEEGEESAQ